LMQVVPDSVGTHRLEAKLEHGSLASFSLEAIPERVYEH